MNHLYFQFQKSIGLRMPQVHAADGYAQKKGLSGNDKLSAIYAVTLSMTQLHIADKFHFPTAPFFKDSCT